MTDQTYIETFLSFNLPHLISYRNKWKNSCIYCNNRPKKGINRTREHLIPKCLTREVSGRIKTQLSTFLVVRACRKCNQLKGNKTLPEFESFLRNNQIQDRIIMLSNIKKIITS